MALWIPFSFLLITCFAVLLVNAYSPYPSYQSCSNSTSNHCNGVDTECATNHTTLTVSPDNIGLCPRGRYRIVGRITDSSYATRTIRVVCDENPFDVCSAIINSDMGYGSSSQWGMGYGSSTQFYLSDKLGTCKREAIGLNPINCLECMSLKQSNCSECRSTDDSCYYSFYLTSQYSYNNITENCTSQYSYNDTTANCTSQYSYNNITENCTSQYSYNNITDEKNIRTELLQTGFEIKWNISGNCTSCEASGGICYFEACICRDGPYKYNCSDGNLLFQDKWQLLSKYKAALGAISGAFILSIIIFIYGRIRWRKRKERAQQQAQVIRRFMDPLDSRPPSVADFLQAGIPSKYSYRQIKRYTRNFAVKLGQGGFGTVFKGVLANGCIVAVKILDKSKHSQIQFLNEVATIGRIHHLHLVRLLGYCLKGSKRALIYEYMVNGSLEKYIHGDDQNVLNWKQLYSIAMGIARGIAYLHDECRSKILHCDIKPHNVLLDVNFSPKVADFGLAKLTDREESHVSLTGARGTPGYVAPEVWSRNYGPITDRSDVYSYGMLVMEMVGGRKNFDMKASRSSKIYYPEWAFKQVEMGEFQNLRGDNITDDEDEIIAKKLSMLGLWCIQYNPSHRPSMSRVIQMLEETIDITMPPQPFPIDTPVQTVASTESSSSI